MATLTCTACGRSLSTDQFACECGAPRPRHHLRPNASWAPNDDAQPKATPPDDDLPPQPIGEGCDDEDGCDHRDARPGALTCPTCGSVLVTGGGFVIRFPWGPHRLEPGQELALGRETGPFQSQIRAYPTVSRRHAALRCTPRGTLLLIDEGAANSTFHNGAPVPPHTSVEVRAGDRLTLSSRLELSIEEG